MLATVVQPLLDGIRAYTGYQVWMMAGAPPEAAGGKFVTVAYVLYLISFWLHARTYWRSLGFIPERQLKLSLVALQNGTAKVS